MECPAGVFGACHDWLRWWCCSDATEQPVHLFVARVGESATPQIDTYNFKVHICVEA